jgi:hypothetical protein
MNVHPGVGSALSEGDPVLARVHHAAAVRQPSSLARIRSWSLDRVEVEVDTDDAGTLIVHELDYPGWVAEVDGRPAPILRSNALFRSVEVSRGRHVVAFRFQPLSLANLREAWRDLWKR